MSGLRIAASILRMTAASGGPRSLSAALGATPTRLRSGNRAPLGSPDGQRSNTVQTPQSGMLWSAG
jgi:hypothetical protein